MVRGLGRAEPPHLAALEGAEELDLERAGHLRDLVQEQGAAVGLLEEAELVHGGAGEGAPHVAEELGLEQGLRHRAAVHGHERARRARAGVVHGLGDDLLARAGLALDQERGVGGGDALDEVQHRVHGGRLRDEPGEPIALAELGAQVLVLPAQGPAGQRLVDTVIELVWLLAFLEVVQRPEADGLLGGFPLGVGGEQDHFGRRGMGLGRPQHVQAVAVRHAEIGDDEVEDFLREALGRGGDAVGLQDAMAALAEEQRQGGSRRGLVVHDQEVCHGQAASSGNSMVTRVPSPGSESIWIRPPCAETMRSAMVRPSPVPLGLPE